MYGGVKTTLHFGNTVTQRPLNGASRSSFLGNGYRTASVPAGTSTLETCIKNAKQNC
jgi:hypothetical protein